MAEKKMKVETKIKFDPIDIVARKALDFHAGDTVRVWSKILDEKGKARLQAFEGIVLARKHGRETGATFTVRKVASGVGVERIYPIHSPSVEKIEVVRHGKVRRAKLYYLRTAKGKKSRLKKKDFSVAIAPEPVEEAISEETPTPVEETKAE